MNARSPITTHVLDISRGTPAVGISVQLDVWDGKDQWRRLGAGLTDTNGRLNDLMAGKILESGRYRLTFATGAYYGSLSIATLYPQVTVEFEITAPGEHFHIPLLLSPFGYSTYRGV